jgi:hypothetical protein
LSSIDDAASAVGSNAEHARELVNGVTASKEIIDSLAGAMAALGLEAKASEAQAASDRAEELAGHANTLADALDSLRAQVEALRGLLTSSGASGAGAVSQDSPPQPASPRPVVTKPALPPDSARRPRGPATTLDGDKTRSLELENESAIVLARAGYDIEQNPESSSAKNPDYRIQGQLWDCYAPQGSSAKNIRKTLRNKVHERQASRIVLNLDDCGASPAEIRERLQRDPIRGLKEIKVVRKGVVTQFYPWDSEAD